jgi:hypothetical protein
VAHRQIVDARVHSLPKLTIPHRWDAAVDTFERSKILPEYLDKD